MEKEKLRIETLIKDISFLNTDIDEEILEFEYIKEIALQIREAELWRLECEFLEIYCIEEINRGLTTVYEKHLVGIDKLNICRGAKILSWVTRRDKNRIIRSIYVYLLNHKMNENFNIEYYDRYVTT